MDAFDVLGLAPAFDLDPAVVEREYLKRSAAAHPDLARDDPEATRSTAVLNGARLTLEDPERRADALLIRLGGPAREAEKRLPPGFLADILEVREAVEAGGAARDPVARARWREWADQRRRDYIAQVGAAFRALGARPAPEALVQIRVTLNAWRYVERLIEQLDPGEGPAARAVR